LKPIYAGLLRELHWCNSVGLLSFVCILWSCRLNWFEEYLVEKDRRSKILLEIIVIYCPQKVSGDIMKLKKKCLEVRYEDFTELVCNMLAQYETGAVRL
jgi:hypothetical protein